MEGKGKGKEGKEREKEKGKERVLSVMKFSYFRPCPKQKLCPWTLLTQQGPWAELLAMGRNSIARETPWQGHLPPTVNI